MKNIAWSWSVGLAGLVALAAGVSAQEFELKLRSEGAMGRDFRSYMPTHVTLTNEAPASLKKAPEGLRAPLYGALKLGPTNDQSVLGIIVDEPADGPARLFVDSNGDGDFQNDPPAKWISHKDKRADGSTIVMYTGDGTVNVRFGAETLPLHFNFYRFDKDDPARAALKFEFFYYRDYAQEGEITLAGQPYRVAVDDIANRGAFLPKAGEKSSGVRLWIDVNGDGKFDPESEGWDLTEPFNLHGASYLASVSSAQGNKLQIAPSPVAAVERKPQNAGDPVITFAAKTTAGQPVNFPADYKGKLVLLDFWATWCKPCIAEMPNLTKVYREYHPRGFEVLGISLDDDKKKSVKEVEDFAAGQGLTWAQIYEGGEWQTRLAELFRVQGIPHTLLIDGDTGIILATDDDLHGPALAPTLEKQFAAKKAK